MALFNDRLNKMLLKKNVSQTELAHSISKTKQMVQRYASGKYLPPLDTATAIAKALGVSLDYLTGLSDKEEIDT